MNKSKKGFTLAELLIVIGIVAVLVAITVPMISKYVERSRESTDMANVRSATGYGGSRYRGPYC